MKKFNIKSFLAATMTATVLTLSNSASILAYAESDTYVGTFGGNYAISDPNVYQDYLETLSDEQRQLIDEKIRMDEEAREKTPADEMYAITNSSTKYGLSGTFTMYQQQDWYSCVAACVKSMLKYKTGNSPEQDEINKEIDYQIATIPGYVNDKISETNYVWSNEPSKSIITTRIKRDITEWNIPTFLGIINHYGDNWYYATDGHCVLSNGIYDDEATVLIADPLGGKITGVPYFYEKDAATVTRYTIEMCW